MVVPAVCVRYPLIHLGYGDFRKLLTRAASSAPASGAVLSANSLLPSRSSHSESLYLDDTTQSVLMSQFALKPFVIHKDEYVHTYLLTIL